MKEKLEKMTEEEKETLKNQMEAEKLRQMIMYLSSPL